VIASSFGLRFKGEGALLTNARTQRDACRDAHADPVRGALRGRCSGGTIGRLELATPDLMLDQASRLNFAWYARVRSASLGNPPQLFMQRPPVWWLAVRPSMASTAPSMRAMMATRHRCSYKIRSPTHLQEHPCRINTQAIKKPALGRFFYSTLCLLQTGSGTNPVTTTAILATITAPENQTLSFTRQ